MGRQLRRVALDFDWPLSKTWIGYLNPYSQYRSECKSCAGSGYSPEAKRLGDQWYGYAPFDPSETGSVPLTPDSPPIREWCRRQYERTDQYRPSDAYCMTLEQFTQREGNRLCEMWNRQWNHHLDADDVAALVESRRLHDLTHNWTGEGGWQPKRPTVMPTPEEVNAWAILTPFGHDSINQHVCIKAKCKRLGVPDTCASCNGSGEKWKSKHHEYLADKWQQIEPPEGDGYQLWETVSEGSPVSPVFATPHELATWLVANDTSVTKDTTYEQWMKFIEGTGWAPSGVMTERGYQDGVKAMADMP